MKLIDVQPLIMLEGGQKTYRAIFATGRARHLNIGEEYSLITKRRYGLMQICRAAGLDAIGRLESGDLKHIGDAILSGRTILIEGCPLPVSSSDFSSSVTSYAVAPERITVGDVSFPKPLTEAPEERTECWAVRGAESVHSFPWFGYDADHRRLKAGMLHLTKKAAEEHRTAMVKLSGGEV